MQMQRTLRASGTQGAAAWRAAPAPVVHSVRRDRTICPVAFQFGLPSDVSAAKEALLNAVIKTNRGGKTSVEERGIIEELQVAIESSQGAEELDYSLLGGLWELRYTTADDVIPIIMAEEALKPPLPGLPSPIQVGAIKQRFTSPTDGLGKVDNIIEFSLPFVLEEKKGFTLTVEASYEVRSGHRINLVFDKANVHDIRISEALEAIISPALLPRNPLQHALLMGIKQFKWEFPFRTAQQIAEGIEDRTGEAFTRGGAYQITYLDKDLQLGRSTFMSGIFVLTRVPEDPATQPEDGAAIGSATPVAAEYSRSGAVTARAGANNVVVAPSTSGVVTKKAVTNGVVA